MAPPKPRLVLRIGVTGHRPRMFSDAAQAAVRRKLDALFPEILATANALHAREQAFFNSDPPEIRIVSALAEGADRVVADAGLAAGFALDSLLPFSEEVYEGDFETDESKSHFRTLLDKSSARMILPGVKTPGDPAAAERAYEAVGLITLRQCDILIAVWDGNASSGRGGTEEIVQHAVTTGKPVLRFDASGDGPYLLFASSVEPSDARDLASRAQAGSVAATAEIARLVEHLCAPPRSADEADEHQRDVFKNARRLLDRFLRERERRFLAAAIAYPLLLSVFSKKKGFWKSLWMPRYVEATIEEWKSYWGNLDAAGPAVCTPIRDVVMVRFAWADKLANYYGQLHRSGYVGNFLLAAIAVLCAAIATPQAQDVELGAIFIILATTFWGMGSEWHKRWVDYRQLSSQLRYLRALELTGSSTWEARTPHSSDELQPSSIWVSWYYRMTLREIGLVNTRVDDRYLAIARRAIREGEINDQIDYHEKNASRMESVLYRVEWLSRGAFALTFMICLYEVVAHVGGHDKDFALLHLILNKACVVLPAFGAALFGIRIHGDFEGSAGRSKEMKRRLTAVAARMDDKNPTSLAELSALTEYAVIVMAGEVGDWGFVYRARPLALPT